LSIYAVLLIDNLRASKQTEGKGREYGHHGNTSVEYG
jgi:hypothetical protein